MAEREVEVLVQIAGEDVLAGHLWSHRRQRTESQTFNYVPEYLAYRGAYALDPALPLFSGQQQTPAGRAIFGAFSDCSPDRWGKALIRHRLRGSGQGESAGERSFGEVDYLLGVRDDLRQGALRFRDPESGEFLAGETQGVPHLTDLPELLGMADRVERDVATEEDLERLLKGGSSLGGARPKAHVLDRDGRIAIAKFPRLDGDAWDVIGWESITLGLARAAGLAVADSSLHEIARRPVLIVDRFDRDGERRVGYVSAMTMLEATDGEGSDDRTYLDVVEVIEEQSDRTTADLRQLWRRIAFSILVSNTDDHLRNHGFLRTTGGGWSLSPAFDLNPDPEPGRKLFSTSIDGSTADSNLEMLLSLAEVFRLSEDQARGIVAEVSEATDRWRETAKAAGQSAKSIADMESAFEHESAALAREIAEQIDSEN
jgi:serine/threonine-protein kinase HipA